MNLDYHVEIDKHFYSVPFRLLRAGSGGADHRQDGGDLPPWQAGGNTSAQPAPASADHGGRSHAEFAPALPRLDARTDPARSRRDRRRHRGPGRDHPALASASRAGVPLLHRHPRAGQTLRRRAAGRRLRPGAGARHPLLQLGRRDPEECQDSKAAGAEAAQPVCTRTFVVPATIIERRDDADPPPGRATARPRPGRHGRRVPRDAEPPRRPPTSRARTGSACCSTARSPRATTSVSAAG